MHDKQFLASQLRQLVQPLLVDSSEAFLLVDDSVQAKRYRRFIALAKRPYSDTTHGLVTGMDLVNLVHIIGEVFDFLTLGFLVYAPQQDGLTKNDYLQALCR